MINAFSDPILNCARHTKLLEVTGEHFTDRLRKIIKRETDYRQMPMLTDEQIGVVVRSLGDHTANQAMVNYDRRKMHKPDEEDDFWPDASSVGRFLRDAGYAFLNNAEATDPLIEVGRQDER